MATTTGLVLGKSCTVNKDIKLKAGCTTVPVKASRFLPSWSCLWPVPPWWAFSGVEMRPCVPRAEEWECRWCLPGTRSSDFLSEGSLQNPKGGIQNRFKLRTVFIRHHFCPHLRMFCDPMPEHAEHSHSRHIAGDGAFAFGRFLEVFLPGRVVRRVSGSGCGHRERNGSTRRTRPRMSRCKREGEGAERGRSQASVASCWNEQKE